MFKVNFKKTICIVVLLQCSTNTTKIKETNYFLCMCGCVMITLTLSVYFYILHQKEKELKPLRL